MTTSTTTFFDAYEYFHAAIQVALEDLSDKWVVFDGDPRSGEYNYVASVLGSTTWENEPAGIGAGAPSFPLDEKYMIQARLACWDGSTDQSLTRKSIRTAYSAIQGTVRADPRLGGLVLWSYLTASEYAQGATSENGSFAQIDLYLNITARIS